MPTIDRPLEEGQVAGFTKDVIRNLTPFQPPLLTVTEY